MDTTLPPPIPVNTYLTLSGVYVLSSLGRVVYVGQSRNVPARIHRHNTDGKLAFDELRVLPYEPAKLLDAERYWIERLLPRDNRTGTTAKVWKDIDRAESLGLGDTDGDPYSFSD